jgi:hypothetical protein
MPEMTWHTLAGLGHQGHTFKALERMQHIREIPVRDIDRDWSMLRCQDPNKPKRQK